MTLGLLFACVYARQPQPLHKQHVLLYLLSWAYSVCVLFAVLLQQRGALHHIRFYVSFSSLLFAGSFAGHFENTTVPYRRPPRLHSENKMIPYQLPLRFTLRTSWLRLPRNIYTCIATFFKFFTTRQLLSYSIRE